MDRKALRERGGALRRRLGIGPSALGEAVGFGAYLDEAVYGSVWGRGVITLEERMLCTLAALCALGRSEELPPVIEAALDTELEPRALVEVFVQSGLYGGWGTAEIAIAHTERLLAARGRAVDPDPPREESLEALSQGGQSFLEALHGERGTQGYASPDNPVTGELYALATQYGYGELWLRPGLDRRGRLFCALAAFAVMGLETQLRKFSLSALRVGFRREEIIETLIQTAPYGGFPRALNALAVFAEAEGSS